MNGLEVIIAKEGESEGRYFRFPTTRTKIWDVLCKNGIEKNKWHLAAVKTGSNQFGEAVLASRSLDELNYLGYMMDQLTDEEYGERQNREHRRGSGGSGNRFPQKSVYKMTGKGAEIGLFLLQRRAAVKNQYGIVFILGL